MSMQDEGFKLTRHIGLCGKELLIDDWSHGCE